jgi:hypothetical protein
VNRFEFVADHQRRFGVKRLCTILNVARSSFCYRRRTANGRVARQTADAQLAARIRTAHRDSDGTYGVPRINAELREMGELVNHKRVARIMRQAGLAGLRYAGSTAPPLSDPAAAKAADLIGRDVTAAAVNTKYVGDITHLPLAAGTFLGHEVRRPLLCRLGGSCSAPGEPGCSRSKASRSRSHTTSSPFM